MLACRVRVAARWEGVNLKVMGAMGDVHQFATAVEPLRGGSQVFFLKMGKRQEGERKACAAIDHVLVFH